MRYLAERAEQIGAPLADAAFDAVGRLALGGGKRVRPRFVAFGAMAAGCNETMPEHVDIASAVELLHVSALLHDDVVDGAATRRGEPTAHVREATRHRASSWAGEARRYGDGVAILAGDLAAALADELASSGIASALSHWRAMKSEVALGQVIDHVATARKVRDATESLQVVNLKTSMYTVVRPLLLGAAQHDPSRAERLAPVLEAYGSGVGEAFQLRDDVLGVFGDPGDTGKPVGDDLREGKPTWLLAEAVAMASDAQRTVLDTVGGDVGPHDIARIQDVIVDLGVLDRVEERIARRTGDAVAALAGSDISESVADQMAAFAHALVARRA
ncbi:MAG: polyprenyl synthetase family protein [Ilumatobacteraceae bacterium]